MHIEVFMGSASKEYKMGICFQHFSTKYDAQYGFFIDDFHQYYQSRSGIPFYP